MEATELLVVGAGPAGLAVALEAASRGLGVIVLERQPGPPDKACGEGLGPRGVRALERLGVLAHLRPEACAPFSGIRFVEGAHTVEGRFWTGEGMGIRRTALVAAMAARARELGVSLRFGEALEGFEQGRRGIRVDARGGPLSARLLVAADGIHSTLRRQAGIRVRPGPPRFGLRRHFAVAPWCPFVEIHLGASAEAYVTPVGPRQIGLAFLWRSPRHGPAGGRAAVARRHAPAGWDALLEQFPALAARLAGAEPRSEVRGAGPLGGRAERLTAGRLALIGDAAGTVDPISGEGLSLAFDCARALVRSAATALGPTPWRWAPYQAAYALHFERARILAAALLALAERPALRGRAVRLLAREPAAFRLLLAAAG